jgi:hypothetical protein
MRLGHYVTLVVPAVDIDVVGTPLRMLAQTITCLFSDGRDYEVGPGHAAESPESCQIRASHIQTSVYLDVVGTPKLSA